VNFLENIYLYNVDDLQAIAEGYLKQRRDEIAACEKIINEKAAELIGQRRGPGFQGSPKTAGA
jgi:glutamyl-tRNA reductase